MFLRLCPGPPVTPTQPVSCGPGDQPTLALPFDPGQDTSLLDFCLMCEWGRAKLPVLLPWVCVTSRIPAPMRGSPWERPASAPSRAHPVVGLGGGESPGRCYPSPSPGHRQEAGVTQRLGRGNSCHAPLCHCVLKWLGLLPGVGWGLLPTQDLGPGLWPAPRPADRTGCTPGAPCQGRVLDSVLAPSPGWGHGAWLAGPGDHESSLGVRALGALRDHGGLRGNRARELRHRQCRPRRGLPPTTLGCVWEDAGGGAGSAVGGGLQARLGPGQGTPDVPRSSDKQGQLSGRGHLL